MNNWANVSYWVFMAAMLRMSCEVEASQNGLGEEPGEHSDETAEKVKRFASLPPVTQERVLAYGEKMLEYLREEDEETPVIVIDQP